MNNFPVLMFFLYANLAVAMVHKEETQADKLTWWVQCNTLAQPVEKDDMESPEFEYFPHEAERYFQQLGSTRKQSRYSFAHSDEGRKQADDELSSPISLEDALALLQDKELQEYQYCHMYAISQRVSQKEDQESQSGFDVRWQMSEPMKCVLQKYMHKDKNIPLIQAVCFILDKVPSDLLLRRLQSIADDDGPYQLVKITAPKPGSFRSEFRRDLERQAQALSFSFSSRDHLEWRRFSDRLFLTKIQKQSSRANKGSIYSKR
ncbi:MAG TPA: hypothetical protein VI521_00255 [Candidatus Babeliales bacterium]|nr:hypothetical protein [Candidatus Babeliales bacterium]